MSDTKKNAIAAASNEAVVAILALPTKSAQIRALAAEGFPRGEISQILTNHYGKLVRYQHVRNVLETKLASQD